MGLRELKEAAHEQFVRGKFAQCAQTYQQVLRLAPRDPNMRVRHAEACRRSGDRLSAIASYRAAADLLLELGCESRARGALKAALELDPKDPLLLADIARLEPQSSEGQSSTGYFERELPMLPPLEAVVEPIAPPPPRPRPVVPDPLAQSRTAALPKIYRALPAAPSIPPLVPPVLLPGPSTATPPTRAVGSTPGASALPPRSATLGHQAPTARPATSLPPRSATTGLQAATLPPRSATTGFQAPPAAPNLPPRSATQGLQAAAARPGTPPPLPPRSTTRGFQAPVTPPPVLLPVDTPAPAPQVAVHPPPPPAEALTEENLVQAPPATPAPRAPAPEPAPRPRLEVRRLSPNTLAFRSSPEDSWALIRSRTPLDMHLVQDLENLPTELQDFTIEIKVNAQAEGAPSAMH